MKSQAQTKALAKLKLSTIPVDSISKEDNNGIITSSHRQKYDNTWSPWSIRIVHTACWRHRFETAFLIPWCTCFRVLLQVIRSIALLRHTVVQHCCRANEIPQNTCDAVRPGINRMKHKKGQIFFVLHVTTYRKTYCSAKWESSSPKFRGETSINMLQTKLPRFVFKKTRGFMWILGIAMLSWWDPKELSLIRLNAVFTRRYAH